MDHVTLIEEALRDKFEIQSVIGKGGMATVYKAIQISLNRPVALKVLHFNLGCDEELTKRFILEARTCASLNHPNIITIYDFGSINNLSYIVMEYLEGATLWDVINQRGALNVEDSIRYIVPIAEGLHHMHSRGIVHRDVKSSNIFITTKGRPVLMDFGIVFSQNREQLTRDGAVLGTPGYTSPEQIDGKVKIDSRSDIFSLGVVLFLCITGRLPFQGENYLSTLFQVKYNQTPDLSIKDEGIPLWLNVLIKACLEKDRNNRIQDGLQLATILRENLKSVNVFTKSEAKTINLVNPENQVKFNLRNAEILGEKSSISNKYSRARDLTDIDGNTYRTVKIGSQTWMAENLKTTRFKDGEIIPYYKYPQWGNNMPLYYCWLKDDINLKDIYGAFYCGLYGSEFSKLSPEGWHIPTDKEWLTLFNFLGGIRISETKPKEDGLLDWNDSNSDIRSDFRALPSGTVGFPGKFMQFGDLSSFWTSGPKSFCVLIHREIPSQLVERYTGAIGFNVRCIKD